MRDFVLYTIWTCLLLLSSVEGRGVPYYDIDNDLYSEVRNLLQNAVDSKVPLAKLAQPKEVSGWGIRPNELGQISGVSVDPMGNPVVFHRGDRIWTEDLFNETDHFQTAHPIERNVVVTLDRTTGEELFSWGANLFYLPHGITVDVNGNVWLTDVGLHQVFKFSPDSNKPSLVLGQKLQPGSDHKHFCKPTAVAVSSVGDFFVADGYCNSRVMRFSADGTFVQQLGHAGTHHHTAVAGSGTSSPHFSVPHGITLNEDADVLCIADRENGRISCVTAGLRGGEESFVPVGQIDGWNPVGKLRIFDISFYGSVLFGVAGSEDEGIAIGFTADIEQGKVLNQWESLLGFHNPHSIATHSDTGSIYVAEIGPNRVWKFVLPQNQMEEPMY